MKNILKIKKLSSALLAGTMIFANSSIKTEASVIDFEYISYNSETRESKIIGDNQNGNTPIKDAVCPEDRGARFVYNGELVDGRTPISEVPGYGKNILVAYNGNETASSVWNNTEDARTPYEVTVGSYDVDYSTGSSYKTYVYPSEIINDFPVDYYDGNENQVRIFNGKKVNDSDEFGHYLRKNGENVFMTYTSDNPNALPQ